MSNADIASTGTGGNVATTITSSATEKTVRFPLILNNQFPDDDDIFPNDFTVERQLEGPQIQIEWSNINCPSEVTEFVLVRRRRRYPLNETDGTVVFQGKPDANVINDLEIEPEIFYFYKLFVKRTLDNRYLSSEDLEGYDMTYQSGEWDKKLYNLLPSHYKKKDVENAEEKGLLRVLDETQDEDQQDIINHIHNQTEKFPQLYRILKVFALQFDQADGLIDQIPIRTNPLKSGPQELRLMAKLFGIDINEDLNLEQMRDQFRRRLDQIKNKGNPSGISDSVSNETGFDAETLKAEKWLLYSNEYDRTSFDCHRPDKMNKATPENEGDYAWGGKTNSLSRFKLILFVYSNSTEELNQQQLNKIEEGVQKSTFFTGYELYVIDKKGKIDRMNPDSMLDKANDEQAT